MKFKYYVLLIVCLLFIPLNVKADELYTTITGNNNIKAGSEVKYTIILDTSLTEYEAEIEYDRDILNFVDAEEEKIDTENKAFSVEKNNPIKINITSEEPTIIVYTLIFNVKNDIELKDTKLNIKTTNAKTLVDKKSIELSARDVTFEIKVSSNEETNIDEEIVDNDKKIDDLKKTALKIKDFFNDYRDIIMYSSLALNLILIIVLIISLKRKKMDYDF